jgi:predicted amidohydrolase
LALDGWQERLFRRYLRWICRPSRVKQYLRGRLPAAGPLQPASGGKVRVAALQLELIFSKNPLDYADQMHRRVKEAAEAGAQLVAFPEYNNVQLFGMLPGIEQMGETAAVPEPAKGKAAPVTMADVVHYISPAIEPLTRSVFAMLAAAYGVHIMAGSLLVSDCGRAMNRAYLYGPDGTLLGTQDKNHFILTEAGWGLTRGNRIDVFETALGRVAMPVCMDATFFETFRILEQKGAEIAVLPIANNEPYNYWLALRGIWPRVQESPMYGIKSAHVGNLLGFATTGRAGIFAPLELTPDGSGVLAEVESPDTEGMAVADLDLEALRELRRDHPWRDRNPELYARYFPWVYSL